MKKTLLSLLLVITFIISMTACGGSNAKEIAWPTSDIAGLIPKPESLVGEISSESERYLSIDIAKMSKDAFESYVDACKSNGFTEDYYGHDGYYSAKNSDGYHLILNYDEEKKEMSIMLSAPSESKEEVVEDTTEEATEEAETDSGRDAAGADLRAFMDGYEAFMDEYVAFMKKYKENPTDTKLLADYGKMMEKYSDFAGKAGNIKEGDYSTEDYKYYLEVLNRCNQKLVEVM